MIYLILKELLVHYLKGTFLIFFFYVGHNPCCSGATRVHRKTHVIAFDIRLVRFGRTRKRIVINFYSKTDFQGHAAYKFCAPPKNPT